VQRAVAPRDPRLIQQEGMVMAEKMKLDDIIETLRQERDEMNLQLHLAKAEVKQEWEQLERKFENLEQRFDSFGNEAKASAGEVAASLRQVAAELDKAYKRLKKSWG
jgi:DNA repair exonuclease SbcCD ATPase subunit